MTTNMERSNVYQRWDDGFVIRRMTLDDEPQVLEWWSDLIMSVELQLTLDMRGDDQDGFYIGEKNGEMVGSLVMLLVADDLQFAGYLYVVEKYRMSGFAQRMITTALEINRRRNLSGIVGFDAMQNLESVYEKLANGKTAYNTTAYEGTVSTSVNREGTGTDIREV